MGGAQIYGDLVSWVGRAHRDMVENAKHTYKNQEAARLLSTHHRVCYSGNCLRIIVGVVEPKCQGSNGIDLVLA